MKAFFVESENQSDVLVDTSSQTTENKGFQDEISFDESINANKKNTLSGSNYNNLIKHFNTDIEISEQNPNLKRSKRLTEEDPEDPEHDFEDGDPGDEIGDGDQDPGYKQSPEFYEQQGKFIADMTDIAVPKGIAYLNGEKGEDAKGIPHENKYKAEKQLKDEIGRAWARVLEEKAVNLTPMQQLIWVNLMAYGLPLSLSIFAFIQRIQLQKQQQQNEMIQTLRAMRGDFQPVDPTPPPANQPADPVQTQDPDPVVTPIQDQPKPTFFQPGDDSEEDEIHETIIDQQLDQTESNQERVYDQEMKICSNDDCQKSYVKGEGFARTKGTKNYDRFCSKYCMYNYTNTKNVQNAPQVKNKAKNNAKD